MFLFSVKHIFTEKAAALSFTKKTRGARFKVFTSRSEAETFSSKPSDELVNGYNSPKVFIVL